MKYFKLLVMVMAVCLCFSLLVGCSATSINCYIFADISECENLEQMGSEEDVISSLEISQDPYLQKLVPAVSYAAKYVSDSMTFELFAYEFQEAADAKQYFENATGKETEGDFNFGERTGMGRYRKVVILQQRAYCIFTSTSDKEEVEQFLGQIFSLQLVKEGAIQTNADGSWNPTKALL